MAKKNPALGYDRIVAVPIERVSLGTVFSLGVFTGANGDQRDRASNSYHRAHNKDIMPQWPVGNIPAALTDAWSTGRIDPRMKVKAAQRFSDRWSSGKVIWRVRRVFSDGVGNWHANMVDEVDATREKTIACSELGQQSRYQLVEDETIDGG